MRILRLAHNQGLIGTTRVGGSAKQVVQIRPHKKLTLVCHMKYDLMEHGRIGEMVCMESRLGGGGEGLCWDSFCPRRHSLTLVDTHGPSPEGELCERGQISEGLS